MDTQSPPLIDLAAYYNQFVGRPPRPYLDDDYTGMAYLPYLVAVAEEVLYLGIQPITPEQLASATASALRRMPVHALEASVVSMAMLAESLVENDAARTLIRRHLAVIGEALEANEKNEMMMWFRKPLVNLDPAAKG